MVLLHMKRSEMDQFLFDTTVNSTVDETVNALVEIHNLRHKIALLKMEGEELAKYGPAKRPDQQGIDEYADAPVETGPHYTQDPTGRRTGNACAPEQAKVLVKTLEEAEAAASKNQVAAKMALSGKMLRDAIDLVRGAVMICYPMGLPDWDPVRLCLEDKDADLAGTPYGAERMEPDNASLWFAGKQMLAEKKLAEFVGRHEKTKAVVKLQKKGQGPPAREPVVDPETQKAMMAWYYKKQEAQKKLADDDDDSFASSSWANPGSLKSHFAGVQTVRLPK